LYDLFFRSDSDIQLERLMQRNSLTQEEALQRISAQLPLADKCKQATYVVENSRSLDETKQQVSKILHCLKSSKRHLKIRLILVTSLLAVVAGIGFGIQKLM
jgi:dephospho-CoA kinase